MITLYGSLRFALPSWSSLTGWRDIRLQRKASAEPNEGFKEDLLKRFTFVEDE
jgi:hypothetical protein